jgi:apolipoprotein N-acyltransferase
MKGATPYSRWKDLPILLLLGCTLGFGALISVRRSATAEN